MNFRKVLKLSVIPLVAGFSFLTFAVTFASFLSGSLQAVSWYTAEMFVGIISGIVVIELVALYVRSQMRLQTPSRISAVKKLARNVVITFFAGLIVTFLFTPLYSMTLAPDTFGVATLLLGHIQGLSYILQSFLSALIQGPFAIYFSVSFVVLSLFDILRTRESHSSVAASLNFKR